MNVLTDKSYKSYDRVSRYSQDAYYYNKSDNKYIYGFSHRLSKDTTYLVHKIVAGDTFDSLSYEYYGNPTYYWVICDFNRINNPFQELTIGNTIKIPSFSEIEFEVM